MNIGNVVDERIGNGKKKVDKIRTKRDMIAMITIPTFHDRVSETAARVWPPMILLRTRNPWRVKTFRALGMMEP